MTFDQVLSDIHTTAQDYGLPAALDSIAFLRRVRAECGPPLTPEERSKLTVAEADLRKRYGGRR